MFFCDKCGLCCKQVGKSHIYKELDRGDGVCKYFDDKSKLCTIYENRPIFCRVDEMYELCFKKNMTKEEYYNLNYKSCSKFKEKIN